MPSWLSRPSVVKDCIRELKPGYLRQIVIKSGVDWERNFYLKVPRTKVFIIGF